MFKILRSEDGDRVFFALSGRITLGGLPELRQLLAAERDASVVLDLREVTLVDRDAIRLLARCEARGISLVNCPPYIREWIVTERD